MRRRSAQEFEQTPSDAGPRVLTLDSLVGGYNGYTDPILLSPQFWAAASNVYAGQFGAIRGARWAPVYNSPAGPFTSGQTMSSIFGYYPPPAIPFGGSTAQNIPYLIMDTQNTTYGYSPVVNNFGSAITGTVADLTGFLGPASLRYGPFQRIGFSNGAIVVQTNGVLRSKIFYNGSAFQIFSISFLGFDTPDASPQVLLTSGSTATIAAAPTGVVRISNIVTVTTTAAHGLAANTYVGISGVTDTTFNSAAGTAFLILTVPSSTTFTYAQIGVNATSGAGTVTFGITKTVGRSYQFAWENVNTGHVSAPSPATQYVKPTSQNVTLAFAEPGTVAINNGSTAVVGTSTAFSPAWVGRFLWIENTSGPNQYSIASVADPTHLTLNQAWQGANQSASRHQVYDAQATHLRVYATGDGQPVYFLIGRNVFTPTSGTIFGSGLLLVDTANSEPPNAPFTSEITQLYNVPPPIGRYVTEYQSRALIYGVPAALQTFFYSNIEATVVGQPPESFSPLNTIVLPIGDGQLNGMANLPTGLIIWSNRQDMFKLTGLLSDNTLASSTQLGATIQRLPYKIGCASPYATAVTPLGAFWLSSDREIWLFTDHYAPKNVGKPIQDVLNRINGRINFARMQYFKRGDRSWLTLAVSLDSAVNNNKLLILDLDLLASNGQPSYFTFDMATNAPTWYQYDVNCESITAAYDSMTVSHLLAGSVDLVTDLDYQTGYYTTQTEQNNLARTVTLHAFGNEDAHMIKTLEWLRVLTNQLPANFAAQGWQWAVNAFDDDKYIIGVNPLTTTLAPGVANPANTLALEYSPAKFRFGGFRPIKGRRFQLSITFPVTAGLWEFKGFELTYTNVVGR